MAYHTALDVSLRSVSICILDDDGAIQYEGKAASDVADIVGCLKRFDPSIDSVGFEAGALTQYLTYGLQAAFFLEATDKPFHHPVPLRAVRRDELLFQSPVQ